VEAIYSNTIIIGIEIAHTSRYKIERSNMVSAKPSVVIGLVSLCIITTSTILQYISHRHSVVDTRFEREQKIKEQLGEEQIKVEAFTEDDYDISIKVFDVDVREESGILYKLKKIIIPTADIDGTTVVKMGIKPDSNIPLGMYTIQGFKKDGGCLRGIVLRLPDSNDMITLEVDTVNPYRVPPTLTNNMTLTDNLYLVDKSKEAEEIGELIEDLSTPSSEPYESASY